MRCSRVLFLSLALALSAGVACGTGSSNGAPGSAGDAGTTVDAGPGSQGGDSALAARGAVFVRNRACPDCHESAVPSDGTLSGQATPRPGTQAYPANLTPDPDTGMDDWTTDQIIRAIRQGKDDEGQDLCEIMPRFKTMPDDEANAIAAYLKTLPPVHHAIPESTCE
jgi:mono/diheme cytochrome c family protein